MGDVSVHIVTHNSGALIARCLESLQAQVGVDFSTCIVDNASTDDTVDEIRRMGFSVVSSPTNLGYAVAHNYAIDHTASRYILTLNPDVWLDPAYLRSMVDALERHPRAGAAAGCLLRVDRLGETPQVIDSAGLYMRRSRRQGLRYEGQPASSRPMQPGPIFGPDGAAAFYRREMLEDIRVMGEVFDSDFFIHKEDVDLCWRAQLRGWSARYVPEALAHHIRGFRPGQRRQMPLDLRFYALRNRYLLLLKNELGASFLRDLWAIVPYDLAIVLYVLLREPRLFASFRSARALARRMREKRRLILSERRVEWRELATWFRP